jgi:hypothetical protein
VHAEKTSTRVCVCVVAHEQTLQGTAYLIGNNSTGYKTVTSRLHSGNAWYLPGQNLYFLSSRLLAKKTKA